jgi:adenosylmethionine-8-amino-7-oxononanoate aminotransferase
LAAVQLKNAASAQDAVRAARAHGVSTRAIGAGALQVSPAFVATSVDIAGIAAGLSAALDALVEPHIPDPRSDGAPR